MSKAVPSGVRWKKFERLVAAIHYAEYEGGQVEWNEIINGRQFDVTIRFQAGPYSYLTVIECKNTGRPVSSERVDALVTKSADIGANKAVIVSAAGFQRGAKNVAQRHGIELFTLEQVNADNLPLTRDLIPEIYIYETMVYGPGNECGLSLAGPEGITQKRFSTLTVHAHSGSCPLSGLLYGMASKLIRNVLNEHSDIRSKLQSDKITEVKELAPIELRFPQGSKLSFPSGEEMSIDSIILRYFLPDTRITSPGFDETRRDAEFKLTNILTAEYQLYRGKSLPIGFDTVVKPGKFYSQRDTGFGIYCKKVDGGAASMVLVEAYRYGVFVQAEYLTSVENTKDLLEITDEKWLGRLHSLLSFYGGEKSGGIFALGIVPDGDLDTETISAP